MAWLLSNIEWVLAAIVALLGAGGAAYWGGRNAGKKNEQARQAKVEEQRAHERTQKVADDAMQKQQVEREVDAGGSARDQLGDSRWVRDED